MVSLDLKTANSLRVEEEERDIDGQTLVIRPSQGWVPVNLKDLWAYRGLLYFLAWRDIRVRYAQASLGIVWTLLKPVSITFVFSIFLGSLAQVPSDGLPYPIFAYCALLPWQLFSQTLVGSSNSLVANQNLLTKVYFPRLLIPLSAIAAGILDFLIAAAVLVGMMAYYRIMPSSHIYLFPLFVLLAIVAALGVGLWFSALNVRYRDVGHALPFVAQLWLFATPVVYPISLVPESWRHWMGLNPMTSVVEGFRWAILGVEGIHVFTIVLSGIVASIVLASGLYYFRRMEQTFADVV
ncbi:MAG TPA: ABC transporter permease [Nitrospiraceae bacterium]|nr:ABC transporter permease [Nitrospiraceae bacterium]